jgi:hypothetical protein
VVGQRAVERPLAGRRTVALEPRADDLEADHRRHRVGDFVDLVARGAGRQVAIDAEHDLGFDQPRRRDRGRELGAAGEHVVDGRVRGRVHRLVQGVDLPAADGTLDPGAHRVDDPLHVTGVLGGHVGREGGERVAPLPCIDQQVGRGSDLVVAQRLHRAES